jgi:hypothetical protein
MLGRGRQEALLPVVGRFLALTDRRPCEDFAGGSMKAPHSACRRSAKIAVRSLGYSAGRPIAP